MAIGILTTQKPIDLRTSSSCLPFLGGHKAYAKKKRNNRRCRLAFSLTLYGIIKLKFDLYIASRLMLSKGAVGKDEAKRIICLDRLSSICHCLKIFRFFQDRRCTLFALVN